jgi:hypothetical protein
MKALLRASRSTWLALLILMFVSQVLGSVIMVICLAAVGTFWSAYLIYIFVRTAFYIFVRATRVGLLPRRRGVSDAAKDRCQAAFASQLAEYWRRA